MEDQTRCATMIIDLECYLVVNDLEEKVSISLRKDFCPSLARVLGEEAISVARNRQNDFRTKFKAPDIAVK